MKYIKNKFLLTTIVAFIALIFLLNFLLLQRHMFHILRSDIRNTDVSAYTHYKYFIKPDSLVIDLRNISNESSPADIFRVLLQFAETQKEKEFADVTLSFRGKPKFILKGEFFHTLGEEYGSQNPIYTMRTFPENVYLLDGTAAFGTWSGGLFGVLKEQLNDFGEFHKQWYINELVEDNI